MMALTSDVFHEIGENKDWNESFYFSFYDRGNDLCGFMRIGVKPNKKEKAVFCFLMMPDGSLIGTKEHVEMDEITTSAGGLNFEKLEDEKKWAVKFDGELPRMEKDAKVMVKVKMDLVFDGLNPMFDYRATVSGEKEKAAAATVASEHLEQMVKATGTITVGEKEMPINGLGERDHSWGVRDWHAPRAWVWLTCQFNEGYGFNITKVWMDKMEIDAGFLYMDGENIPIVKVDTAIEWDADGSPNTLYMAMYDNEGDVFGVKGIVRRKAKMHFHSEDKKNPVVMWETLARFKMDNETGNGIAEFLGRR